MYADLDIAYSRPWMQLYGSDSIAFDDSAPLGDGDGYLDPGETISFYFKINNQMLTGYNARATLSTANPDINFVVNDVTVPGTVGITEVNNASYPIQFTLAGSLEPSIDSFFLTITLDTLNGVSGSGNFSKTFGLETVIGKPNILIVDDDNGGTFEEEYNTSLYNKRVPSDYWHVNTQGTPGISDMMNYDMVFWQTGMMASSVFNSTKISVMKQYMDNNKNICLSTMYGVSDLNSIDPTFLPTYFHATPGGKMKYPAFTGITGNDISDGTAFLYDFRVMIPFDSTQLLNVSGEGQPVFTINGASNYCGMAYSGDYKSLLFTSPIELIDDTRMPTYQTKDILISRIIDFFGGVSTDVYDGEPFAQLPQNFDLSQNYPNPFNPSTTISYTLRGTGTKAVRTNLAIYNIMGQKVKTLVDKVQIPGNYVVEWNSTNDNDEKVASGIYFYRLTRGDDNETKKMVLLK